MSAPPKVNKWQVGSQAFRGLVYQIIAIVAVIFVVWFLTSNTLANMKARGIQSGFGFLTNTAGFDIGETMFVYDSNDHYWKAFAVGLANTLRVAIIGIILTTILGTLIGVGRFSKNGLVRGLCQAYVEVFRNIPILLQLLMWYLVMTELLPASEAAINFGAGFFLSKDGLSFPIPEWATGHTWALIGLVVGFIAVWFYRRWAKAEFEKTGKARSIFWVPLGLLLLSALIGWILGGAPTAMSVPKQGEINVQGGGAITPEFMSVLFGLTVYTAAFVAEVVRAGIQSVPRGQSEAARAIGLSVGQEMRLVMLPQALRVIIPPLTNQYLNLTKNSSLAVAIGYPDLVSIANTSINQTGRAIECIAIIMAVYLTTSLLTSGLMNWYNAKAAIKER